MTADQLVTAVEATGLAFVSFQLGGIFWGIVIAHRLCRPAGDARGVRRAADGRRSATPAAGTLRACANHRLFRCLACGWHAAIPEGATRIRRTAAGGENTAPAPTAPAEVAP